MNDNVIKFQKRKPPRKQRPLMRKMIIIVTVIAVFALAWLYFKLVG
ncbi:hypothetical protein [Rhizobium sp. BK376]|nr:hypothetical protein [Rhizobium sp. BK376]TCR72263.1 hypothetical protein EV561_12912 [Rhizobium sp. BK376]